MQRHLLQKPLSTPLALRNHCIQYCLLTILSHLSVKLTNIIIFIGHLECLYHRFTLQLSRYLTNYLAYILNPFITVVDPSVCTDGFPYICWYCSKCLFYQFSMSEFYKYLFQAHQKFMYKFLNPSLHPSFRAKH